MGSGPAVYMAAFYHWIGGCHGLDICHIQSPSVLFVPCTPGKAIISA
uniref:Uncharacterized protein n=1 Tax=Moniliophthora roreri TaxID=221103 RepID=A0A0W0FFS6_MONRR